MTRMRSTRPLDRFCREIEKHERVKIHIGMYILLIVLTRAKNKRATLKNNYSRNLAGGQMTESGVRRR